MKASAMPVSHSHRQRLLGNFLREVWSEGDVERCGAYLADTYTLHNDPGDPWHGQALDLAAFKARVRQSRAPFPDQRFDLLEMLSDSSKVMVTWNWTGTHRGDLPHFPATGKVMAMSGATVYYFDGADRITGHWQISDRLGIYQQLQQAREA
jgi:steroid delta-isomerase-like uncharacterized protein